MYDSFTFSVPAEDIHRYTFLIRIDNEQALVCRVNPNPLTRLCWPSLFSHLAALDYTGLWVPSLPASR